MILYNLVQAAFYEDRNRETMKKTDMQIAMPRYQQIALDLASQIAKGKYQEGDKVYTRSSVASQYGVSPETARRAVCVLADLEIVEASKGSGVWILSREKALQYVANYAQVQTTSQLKAVILSALQAQKKQQRVLEDAVHQILDAAKRFQSVCPLEPYEIEIREDMQFLNKTVSEINFWHHTGATIVAIQRSGDLIISPGPHANFISGDTFLFIGDQHVYQRVDQFLYPDKI